MRRAFWKGSSQVCGNASGITIFGFRLPVAAPQSERNLGTLGGSAGTSPPGSCHARSAPRHPQQTRIRARTHLGTNRPPRKCLPVNLRTPSLGAVRLTSTSGSSAVRASTLPRIRDSKFPAAPQLAVLGLPPRPRGRGRCWAAVAFGTGTWTRTSTDTAGTRASMLSRSPGVSELGASRTPNARTQIVHSGLLTRNLCAGFRIPLLAIAEEAFHERHKS